MHENNLKWIRSPRSKSYLRFCFIDRILFPPFAFFRMLYFFFKWWRDSINEKIYFWSQCCYQLNQQVAKRVRVGGQRSRLPPQALLLQLGWSFALEKIWPDFNPHSLIDAQSRGNWFDTARYAPSRLRPSRQLTKCNLNTLRKGKLGAWLVLEVAVAFDSPSLLSLPTWASRRDGYLRFRVSQYRSRRGRRRSRVYQGLMTNTVIKWTSRKTRTHTHTTPSQYGHYFTTMKMHLFWRGHDPSHPQVIS